MKSSLPHFVIFALVFFFAQPAFSYLGPGSGIGAIGSLIALIAVVFIATIGFVYYPIKRRREEDRAPPRDFEDFEDSEKELE